MFLKNPKRIEAILMIMTLCLLIYAALGQRIPKELKRQKKTFPNQLGKPVQTLRHGGSSKTSSQFTFYDSKGRKRSSGLISGTG